MITGFDTFFSLPLLQQAIDRFSGLSDDLDEQYGLSLENQAQFSELVEREKTSIGEFLHKADLNKLLVKSANLDSGEIKLSGVDENTESAIKKLFSLVAISKKLKQLGTQFRKFYGICENTYDNAVLSLGEITEELKSKIPDIAIN